MKIWSKNKTKDWDVLREVSVEFIEEAEGILPRSDRPKS